MTDTQGVVTQALANLQAACDHLAALTNLPDGAGAARDTVRSSVAGVVPVVMASAHEVLAFVATARPLIAAAQAALDQSDADGVQRALTNIATAAQPAQTALGASNTSILATIDAVNGQLGVLGQIDGVLGAQVASATNEARMAESTADDLDNKKYYWLALGPLGLIGLGVCIGMIVDANNKVADMRGRVTSLRAQAAQWAKMKVDVDLAMAELPDVGGRLRALQNGISFITSEIASVLLDVRKSGSGSVIAKAFLMAAAHELDLLSQDAT